MPTRIYLNHSLVSFMTTITWNDSSGWMAGQCIGVLTIIQYCTSTSFTAVTCRICTRIRRRRRRKIKQRGQHLSWTQPGFSKQTQHWLRGQRCTHARYSSPATARSTPLWNHLFIHLQTCCHRRFRHGTTLIYLEKSSNQFHNIVLFLPKMNHHIFDLFYI